LEKSDKIGVFIQYVPIYLPYYIVLKRSTIDLCNIAHKIGL